MCRGTVFGPGQERGPEYHCGRIPSARHSFGAFHGQYGRKVDRLVRGGIARGSRTQEHLGQGPVLEVSGTARPREAVQNYVGAGSGQDAVCLAADGERQV